MLTSKLKGLLVLIPAGLLVACGGGVDDKLQSLPDRDDILSQSKVVIEESAEIDAVTKALNTGHPKFLKDDAAAITQRLRAAIAEGKAKQQAFFQQVYANNAINYDPTNRTQFFYGYGVQGAYPIVVGNKGYWLAAATERKDYRSAAFGINILYDMGKGKLTEYQPHMKRLLAWLLSRSEADMTEALSVKFMQVDEGVFNTSRDWLLAQFPQWSVELCDDPAKLAGCATSATDLVVSGSRNRIDSGIKKETLSQLKRNKIPMLYVHDNDGGYWAQTMAADPVVLNHMSLQHRLGTRPRDTASWENYQQMFNMVQSNEVAPIERLVQRLVKGAFDFDLSKCVESCTEAAPEQAKKLQEQFFTPADMVKTLFSTLDTRKYNVFDVAGEYQSTKLLALLGDHYRSKIQLPLNNLVDDQNTILRTWFADYSVYNHRRHNPVQPDLGTFSRTDFSHITPKSVTLDYLSVLRSSAAGVYGLPGTTVRVTRLDDNAELETKVSFNSLRAGSTKLYSSRADRPNYQRPRFVKSTAIAVQPGETIYMTSPYGGPIQIHYNLAGLQAKLRFENIGLHPFWDGPEDNAKFDAAIDAGDFDWAELVTPNFQVHSTLEKMRKTFNETPWKSGADLSRATLTYHHNYPNAAGGRKGIGIDPIPEVMQYVDQNDWQMYTLTKVLHMNADRATCGYLCSGNPYDSSAHYDPVSHGGLHELGHSIQSYVLDGFSGHAGTNFYSYYTKSLYNKETGNDPDCQRLPFASMYQSLLESRTKTDPHAYMKGLGWAGWQEGVSLVIQMFMAAQHEGALDNGWHLLPLLHILEYNTKLAAKKAEDWEAKKQTVGFDQYSHDEIKTLLSSRKKNDLMLVAIGYITKIDFSEFFEMWGLPVSAKAKNQVATYNDAELNFYNADKDNFCYGLDKEALAID